MNKSMNKKSINLSAVGLKNLVINEEEKFKFIIGEKEIQMNKFFAEFISPTVSHIHHFDPTINSIDITQSLKKKSHNEQQNQKRDNILQKLSTEHTLTQILNLSEGQYIEIEDKSDLISLRYFSILLNNDELLHKIDLITTNEEISDEELLEEISFLSEIKSNMNDNIYSKLIDEISSRISDDNKNLLEKVPKHIFYLILHNEHFKYDYYDTLFEIINKIFSKENVSNVEYKEEDCINSFYEQIDINKLNKNNYEEFIKNLSYTEMTVTIWEQLRTILLESQHEKTGKINQIKEGQKYEFDGQSNHRFNGIIQHLRGTENKNICDLDIIDVTASSYQSNDIKSELKTQSNNIKFETNAQKVCESIKGTIVKANGIPKIDSDGSDTYVILKVISKDEKIKTDVQYDTQDPVWNKDFEFSMATNEDSLRAEIYHYHKVLGDLCIACVEIPLKDLKKNQPIEQAFKLDKPRKVPKVVKKVTDFGTLTLSLSYNVEYK